MSSTIEQVGPLLSRLEDELRRLHLWADQPPSAEALESSAPFCCDRMGLQSWLQWVYLPRMRGLLERGERLPAHSGIAPMAEVYFQQRPQPVVELIALLRELDRAIEAGGR
jgi:uncharacterized protein YqcC (DUF446 family)